jgi:hypothetical protein
LITSLCGADQLQTVSGLVARIGDTGVSVLLTMEGLSTAEPSGVAAWLVETYRELADPEFRARLEASLRRLDEDDRGPALTREEFLAQTADLDG